MGNGLVYLDNSNGADFVGPTVVSASINTAGDTLTVNYNKTILPTSGITGHILQDVPGLSLSNGTRSGTTSATFPITGGVVTSADVPTLDYSPGNLTNQAGAAMASFSGQSVDNNSTQEDGASVLLSMTGASYTWSSSIYGNDDVFNGSGAGSPWHSDSVSSGDAFPKHYTTDFGSGSTNIVKELRLQASYQDGSHINYMPNEWQILGSSTGTFGGEETILFSEDNGGSNPWSTGSMRASTFANSTHYRYLRIKIISTFSPQFAAIGEGEWWGVE